MRLNILAKMLLFILLPSLLGLCAVAALDYRGAEKTVLHLMDEESTLVLERQKSELTNVTNLLADVLRNGATGARILNYLHADAVGQGTEELRAAAQAQVLSLSDSFPLLSETGLLNVKGTMLAHTNPKVVGSSRADRAYFQESIKGKRAVENLVSRSTGKPAVIMSLPIEENGKILGVIFASLDTLTLSKNLTDTIKIGETGICYVYTGKGILLMHPNKSYVGDDDAQTPWVKAMMAQKNGSVAYEWKGVPKLAYFRHLPEMDWYVTVAMEERDFYDDINEVLRNTMIVVPICGVLVALIIFLVARSIAQSIRSCSRVVARVAEGELTLTEEAQANLGKAGTRSDEIGSLARGVGRMIENIRRLFAEGEQKTAAAEKATEEAHVAMAEAEEARRAAENAKRDGMLAAAERLEGIVNILSSASEQLSAQIEQSERGAAEQAARVAETATAMEEMNSTVLEVARNAGTATDVTTRTREMAASGASVVNHSVISIHNLQQQSLSLKDDMTALDEHARAISQIMGVISDIADQTNLLALNAAIEAARAGDAGRGFAVVADEVRKLAEKTMASTTDVGNAIRSIQTSADKSARQVDVAVQTIGEVTASAEQSGSALKEIVTMAESSADQVRAIAAASEQQSATSEEINRSIGQVSSIANETSRAMQEAASAVSELARQAQELGRLIDEMKRG